MFRLKSSIDDFEYHFEEINSETNEVKRVTFQGETRLTIVSFYEMMISPVSAWVAPAADNLLE